MVDTVTSARTLIGVDFSLERTDHPDMLLWCAQLMVASPPWSVLDFTEQSCFDNLSLPDLDVRVACNADGTKMGFAATFAHGVGTEPLLEYLCVHPDFRNKKVGTALIAHFETVLFPSAANLYMFVSDINIAAKRLYERLGYSEVGALHDFNAVGQTEFLMRKTRRPTQQRFVHC